MATKLNCRPCTICKSGFLEGENSKDGWTWRASAIQSHFKHTFGFISETRVPHFHKAINNAIFYKSFSDMLARPGLLSAQGSKKLLSGPITPKFEQPSKFLATNLLVRVLLKISNELSLSCERIRKTHTHTYPEKGGLVTQRGWNFVVLTLFGLLLDIFSCVIEPRTNCQELRWNLQFFIEYQSNSECTQWCTQSFAFLGNGKWNRVVIHLWVRNTHVAATRLDLVL